jgi:hypothetical protein
MFTLEQNIFIVQCYFRNGESSSSFRGISQEFDSLVNNCATIVSKINYSLEFRDIRY